MSEDEKKLSAHLVHEMFLDCLHRDGEPVTRPVIAKGIMHNFGFHPERLAGHADAIRSMLRQLPLPFHPEAEGGGGGWSFLQMCEDRNGELWAQHPTMEELMCLGIALNMVRYLLPRDVWGSLPGGVPYIAINVNGFPTSDKPEAAGAPEHG